MISIYIYIERERERTRIETTLVRISVILIRTCKGICQYPPQLRSRCTCIEIIHPDPSSLPPDFLCMDPHQSSLIVINHHQSSSIIINHRSSSIWDFANCRLSNDKNKVDMFQKSQIYITYLKCCIIVADPSQELIVYTLRSVWAYPFSQNDITTR